MKRAKIRKGYTVIEIMVVIAISLAFFAILVPAYFRMRANSAVNAAGKIVLSDIKRARDLAVTKGSGSITLGGSWISIADGSGTVVWREALPFGATLTTDWGTGSIVFSQNGRAALGGAAQGIITIAHPAASLARQIRIISFTGASLEP